jgi:hypothetical protein
VRDAGAAAPLHPSRRVAADAPAELLPRPVARYLQQVLATGQPPIRQARLQLYGLIRTRPERGRWTAFDATDTVDGASPAYVSEARLHRPPLLHWRRRESYAEGRRERRVTWLAAIALARAGDDADAGIEALQRYLAAAVWYPTALRPNQSLRWAAIDEQRAVASLHAGAITVSLQFHFDARGEIVEARTVECGQSGGRAPRRWLFSDYQPWYGIRVPERVQAARWLRGDWRPVLQAQLLDARFDCDD